jgi:GTPase SAR1 family protein
MYHSFKVIRMTEQTEQKPLIVIEEDMSEKIFDMLLKYLTENGKLMIIGLGGTGKSTLAMYLVRWIMQTKEYKQGKVVIRIGDTANVWKLKFDAIPYVDVTKRQTIPDEEPTLLLDLGFLSTERNVAILENLVAQNYYSQREQMDKNRGQTPIERIYVFEEIQNLFGSNKKSDFWLRIWSEGRNYGQFFIGLAQRLSDVSTQIVERTKWMLIGSLSGDNDRGKIRRMFGKETGNRVIHVIEGLRQGEFLLVNKDNPENSYRIYFPAFQQNGQPYELDTKGNGHIRVRREFL